MPPITAQSLRAFAQRKQRDLLQDDSLIALALTGSLPRGTVWEGSDLDFWGFSSSGEGDFRDGVEDGIYWEIDIAPAAMLQIAIDDETWLNPPAFHDGDTVSLLEALSGCEIIHDPTGQLARVTAAIHSRLTDPAWMRRRAGRYLSYAAGVLDALTFAPPIPAILHAREIATNYVIAAYWMRQGSLLTSAIRIPERLAAVPEIQRLYCDIFALDGQTALDEFMRRFAGLPDDLRDDLHSDVYNEALPAARRGAVDGALRYLRFMMMEQALEEGRLDDVLPCLALDAALPAHQSRILAQCCQLLTLVRAT
jgi:hypothetical protein